MNRLITALAIVTSLAIIQGCTPLPNAKEEPTMTATTQHHPDQAVAETNRHHSHENTHGHTSATNQTKLTAPDKISPNTSVSLQIDVQDQDGKTIAQFDRFQEQMMHLIAVSDDLQIFQHLHPSYKGNGRFEVETQFPQPGNYTLFSDYQPTGQAEQVSVLKTQVAGNHSPAAEVNWSRTKTINETIVGFAPTQATIRAGQEVILRFNLQDATNYQPITDLQPYLGEKGHLVILRQSAALTRENYIHAHALHQTPTNQVHFATRFPQPGKYKLWGQFNRDGEIITADFWVEVVP